MRFHGRSVHRVGVDVGAAHLGVAGLLVVYVIAFAGWPVWGKLPLVLVICVLAVVTIDDWLASRWLMLAITNRWRRVRRPVLSATGLGCIACPGEQVAVRWEGEQLVALVGLAPRPFTPTIITAEGATLHDDCVDTQLVHDVMCQLGCEVSVDVVSAGWRVAHSAPAPVWGFYEQIQGSDPAPAFRRTWIVVRVDPYRVLPGSRWRGEGVAAVATTVVAAATRIAEALASSGVDARPQCSFDQFDELTGADEVIAEHGWSALCLRGAYTTVFSAAGGPDAWWSQRADRTVTRTRIRVGEAPRSVVALTTLRPIERDPAGWIRLRGTQLDALGGATPIIDRHRFLPIGSAGMLVGRTAVDDLKVYVSFDAAEAVLQVGDGLLAVHVVMRAAALGAALCLPAGLGSHAASLGAEVGDPGFFRWVGCGVRTWLGGQPAGHVIRFDPHRIVLPRSRIELAPIRAGEETVLGLSNRSAGQFTAASSSPLEPLGRIG